MQSFTFVWGDVKLKLTQFGLRRVMKNMVPNLQYQPFKVPDFALTHKKWAVLNWNEALKWCFLTLLSSPYPKVKRAVKEEQQEKDRGLTEHAQWFGVTKSKSLLSSLFLCILVKGHRLRGKDERSCFLGGWMIYREEEVTVLYRPHLLLNGVSSLSSIPPLISS